MSIAPMPGLGVARMLNRTVTTEQAIVTPEIAKYWLETFPFGRQRRISRTRVEKLVRMMRAGLWRHSTIVFAELDDRLILIDAYHRLTAVIESGVSISVTIERRRCRDMEEVALEYGVIDVGQAKTPAQMAAAAGLCDELEITEPQLRKLSNVAPLMLGAFRSSQIGVSALTSAERNDFIRRWGPSARLAFDTIGWASDNRRQRRLYNAPVFAVALVTLRYAPGDAADFWRRIARNDGLMAGTPSHALLEYIERTTVRAGEYPEYARRVAASWNAHMEDREHNWSRVNNKLGPIRIAGTPYDGQAHIYEHELEDAERRWLEKRRRAERRQHA